MRRLIALGLVAGAVYAARPAPTQAQQTEPHFLAVGQMAPDFSLPGASRYGVLANPVKLSDYRGETVVLAFFYQVRTPG